MPAITLNLLFRPALTAGCMAMALLAGCATQPTAVNRAS
jgi:hypothetical protein